MNPQQASINLSFDKTKSGLLSVKLRVTYLRDRQRYAFPIKEGVLVSEADFDRLASYHQTKNKRAAEEVKALYSELKPFPDKAEAIAQKLVSFSFDAFRDAFYGTSALAEPKTDVIGMLEAKAARLDAENHIGNSDNYTTSARSFERFISSLGDAERQELLGPSRSQPPTLHFEHITPKFLARYERWMLQFGKAPRVKPVAWLHRPV